MKDRENKTKWEEKKWRDKEKRHQMTNSCSEAFVHSHVDASKYKCELDIFAMSIDSRQGFCIPLQMSPLCVCLHTENNSALQLTEYGS